MQRFLVLLLAAWLVAGCAVRDWGPLDRRALVRVLSPEKVGPAPRSPRPARFLLPQEEEPVEGKKKGKTGEARQERAGQAPAAPEQPREESGETTRPWKRPSVEAELAVVRSTLKRTEGWRRRHARRVVGVTGFAELIFPRDAAATRGLGAGDLQWDELADGGWGVGLELSYQLLPVVQPFLGVKYDGLRRDAHTFESQGTVIRRENSTLRLLPFYAGLRVNLPLNQEPRTWFSPSAAGQATGVIPFVEAAGGGAYSFGSELTIRDVTHGVAPRLDFVRRGFTGYVEGAVGVEYRADNGFAIRVSVGVERYLDLKLDRGFERAFPGVDLRRYDEGVLPRISASFYF